MARYRPTPQPIYYGSSCFNELNYHQDLLRAPGFPRCVVNQQYVVYYPNVNLPSKSTEKWGFGFTVYVFFDKRALRAD